MPRSPIAGIVSGLWGLAWTALGLVLAAWAATTALDAGRGLALALRASERAGIERPDGVLSLALANLPVVGIAGVAALVVGLVYLRKARAAFRPANQSQDGKGELQLGLVEPRVGRAFEGSIRLADAPTPGEEFDLVLVGSGPGASPYRVEHKARARQGAHGVNLPFRFDVPVSAPSGPAAHWRLEFAPAGRRAWSRSAFDVKLGAPDEAQVRASSLARAEASAPVLAAESAMAPAGPAVQGYVEQIEKLYGAVGGRLTEAQRERIRSRLSSADGQQVKQQLDAFKGLKPEHLRKLKYLLIAFAVLFFVVPIVLSILGVILGAVFGA